MVTSKGNRLCSLPLSEAPAGAMEGSHRDDGKDGSVLQKADPPGSLAGEQIQLPEPAGLDSLKASSVACGICAHCEGSSGSSRDCPHCMTLIRLSSPPKIP